MRILGIGVDIIDNRRIRSLIKNKTFVSRTYTKNEVKLSKNILNKTNYFAKRFAAKESLAKSLGTGFRENLHFKDIEISNDKIGKPFYNKSKKIDKSTLIGEALAKRAKEKNIEEVYFDRGEYKYHGRIKVFAETLRKNGLKF